MKKLLILPLMVVAPSVFAAPYVGVQYGVASVSQDHSTHFNNDNVTLKPDGSSDVVGAFVGYQFNDNLALEFGYSQYKAEDSHSVLNKNLDYLFPGTQKPQTATHETEWDAHLKAHRYTLQPFYLLPLTDSIKLKAGLGLTLTQYSYHSAANDEYEAIANDDIEHTVARAGGEHKDENAVGGVATLGLDYRVCPHFNVGMTAQYQADHIANATEFMLNASYHF